MGTWNSDKPYGNDIAADWLGDFMRDTGFRARWYHGIREDPAKEPEVVRAATWLFEQLGYVYVWPIENYEADLELAIQAADSLRVLALQETGSLLAVSLLEARTTLMARRKPAEKTA